MHPRALWLAIGSIFFAGNAVAADAKIYGQILGGVVQATTLEKIQPGPGTSFYDLTSGSVVAGTIGVVVADSLSIEIDAMRAARGYDGVPYFSWETTSIMGNLKYTLSVNDTVSVYAAGGLGRVFGTETYPTHLPFNFSGWGFQAIGGASVAVSSNLSIVGEVRYLDAIGKLHWDSNPADTRDAPTVALLFGLKAGY